MSTHPRDLDFSPLLLLVPVPFVLAAWLPLDLSASRAAAKPERVAAAPLQGASAVPLAPPRAAEAR